MLLVLVEDDGADTAMIGRVLVGADTGMLVDGAIIEILLIALTILEVVLAPTKGDTLIE